MNHKTKRSLSELSEDAAHVYKKAAKKAPRMYKEITVASKYFSQHSSAPCVQTYMKMSIDCNLVKLLLLTLLFMLIIAMCNMKRYKRK